MNTDIHPRPPALPTVSAWQRFGGSAFVIMGLVLLLPVLLLWVWFGWRVEPDSNELAVLIRKTGRDLPSGQILAEKPDQKGIQLDVLAAGRYFLNPYTWGSQIVPVTDIPAGKMGVLTRLYGRDLPPGRIIAGEGEKGILADVLRPGKYFINPFAFQIELFDPVTVHPGCVGVVTLMSGRDALNDRLGAGLLNGFVVSNGIKGVQEEALDPGSYYLNPYQFNIVEVNLQSQRFEMSGDDAISFLTQDGFNVLVEGTLEFAIRRDQVALLTHRVGDMEDILKKVILPRARGFSRIEGSKNPAINYIVGETRQQFQNNLESHLRDRCREWGVDVKSVLIRNITPPDEIASIIRDREVAVQDQRKIDQQILQAKSQAELTKQEMLAVQNREKTEADTIAIRALINARQNQAVKLTGASREFAVAKIDNQAADAQVAARITSAKAEQDVIRMNNEAEAGVLKARVQALGSGQNLARLAFYEKVAPRIDSILSTDEAGGLGALFAPFYPAAGAKEVK